MKIDFHLNFWSHFFQNLPTYTPKTPNPINPCIRERKRAILFSVKLNIIIDILFYRIIILNLPNFKQIIANK